tara:strand:+ start:306 stop:494 length:189 start_codon:yes stop_codon:yes gene_type:complete
MTWKNQLGQKIIDLDKILYNPLWETIKISEQELKVVREELIEVLKRRSKKHLRIFNEDYFSK